MQIMAPAKLNLHLEIRGLREDGYHEIRTLFERISLFDRIYLETSDSVSSISANVAEIPTDRKSLLGKTVSLFKEATGEKTEFTVKIEKGIPVGAGMGGGSSDAAHLLAGLNEITGNPLSSVDMEEIAASLGADVPFFLKNRSFCAGIGRGDVLESLETDLDLGHIIVNPPLNISTKEVYGKVSGLNLTKDDAWDKILSAFLEQKNPGSYSNYLRNDLQQIVLREYPFLEEVVSFLRTLGALHVMMTGSGPSIFGLFDVHSLPGAEHETRMKFQAAGGWRVYSARTF